MPVQQNDVFEQDLTAAFHRAGLHSEASAIVGFMVTAQTIDALANARQIVPTVSGRLTRDRIKAWSDRLTQAERGALRFSERVKVSALPSEFDGAVRYAGASQGIEAGEDALRAAVRYAGADLPTEYRGLVASALRVSIDAADSRFEAFASVAAGTGRFEAERERADVARAGEAVRANREAEAVRVASEAQKTVSGLPQFAVSVGVARSLRVLTADDAEALLSTYREQGATAGEAALTAALSTR
jgi:hypothetical protein